MRIIVDSHEQSLMEKINYILSVQKFNTPFQISQETLSLGDVCIKTAENQDVIIIERKSLTDLLASIKDGRYDEQSHRLIHSSGFKPHNIYYIVEGILSQISADEKRLVFSTMASLSYFKGFSVFRTSSIQETAEVILAFTDKIGREFVKNPPNLETTVAGDNNQSMASAPASYSNFVKKVKKDNITKENIGEIILSQIPGISATTAGAIMSKYASFPDLIMELQQNPTCIQDIMIENNGKKRKISKAVVENVRVFLSGEP